MKLGSLFDGIGGWPLAAIHADVEPVWCSEIEPFPQTVTKRHFPKMEQLGDITKIDGTQIAPVDIITIGSPCQDLSIAGKRKGLNGERSGLFRTAIDIVRAMRRATGKTYPQFVVWENVPGAFSSNKGNDFRAVLEEITESHIPMPGSGRWAHAGMVRSNGCEVAWRTLDAQYWGVPQRRKRIFLVADFGGQRAGEILFKPESVRRNTTESSDTGQRTARIIKDCIGAVGKSAALSYDLGEARMRTPGEYVELAPTLSARMGTGGNNVPGVIAPAYYIQGNMIGRADKNGLQGNGINEEVSFTLSTIDRHVVEHLYKVRRLTPTECERLQGFPDGYTLADNKKCSDSARYKALGNGMAQPCADFVIRRIKEEADNCER